MTDEDETETTPAEEDETEADAEAEAGLQNGDFVRIDYTARSVEEDQLIDTTDPAVAEEEGIEDTDQEFSPRTIVLGEGHLFEDVEADIFGKDVGDTGTATVAAANAFGEYDQDAVETVSADKIDEDDRYPGAHVHIGGRHGYVETIIGGRARVDFNHPLAGKDIEYEYELLDVVDDREDQAESIFEIYLDIRPEVWIDVEEEQEEVRVDSDEDDEADADEADEAEADADEATEPEYETQLVEKETLYVESTPQLTMNQQWIFQKQQIAQDIIDTVGVDRVIIQEVLDGMGGMVMPGMMGGAGGGGLEEALEDADIDADALVDELEADIDN